LADDITPSRDEIAKNVHVQSQRYDCAIVLTWLYRCDRRPIGLLCGRTYIDIRPFVPRRYRGNYIAAMDCAIRLLVDDHHKTCRPVGLRRNEVCKI